MHYAPIQQVPREGEVVQMNPDFNAEGNGAEYYSHDTGAAADKDADGPTHSVR